MAHSCPNCDIDDIFFEEGSDAEMACTHCDGESDHEEDFFDDEIEGS